MRGHFWGGGGVTESLWILLQELLLLLSLLFAPETKATSPPEQTTWPVPLGHEHGQNIATNMGHEHAFGLRTTAFAAAVPYIEEWNMAAFVEDQNVRFGLAPSTESLLDRWRRRRAMYPEAFRPLDPGFVAEAKARKWAHRFRARWGVWHGGIRVRDELPLEETRTKAGPEKRPRGGTKSDPGEAPKAAQCGEAKATRGWQNASPKRAHIASSFWARLGGKCKESL